MNRFPAKKTVAAATAVFFLFSVVSAPMAEAQFWAEHRQVSSPAPVPTAVADPALFPTVDPHPFDSFASSSNERLALQAPPVLAGRVRSILKALPATAGQARAVSYPSFPRADAPIIVYIQDVHQNEEVQRNIGAAVEAMIGRGAGLVALEGAYAPIDVESYRGLLQGTALRHAADYLLRTNAVSGAVHAALLHEGRLPPFVGIDDRALHAANVTAYRRSEPRREAERGRWTSRERALERRQAASFPPALKALVRSIRDRAAEKNSLGDYVQALAGSGAPPGPSTRAFLDAFAREKSLDFKEVERERTALIQALIPRLGEGRTQGLLLQSTAYRAGEINAGAFYRFLQELCRESGMPLSGSPAMEAYVRYVVAADAIDGERLFGELRVLERAAVDRLAATPAQKALVAEGKALELEAKLLDFGLSPEEWGDYEELPGRRDPALKTFEDFYRAAFARNRAMSMNLFKALAARRAAAAVLVTGGFHTPGMETLLTGGGCVVVRVVPSVTRSETLNGSEYLTEFTREKTPLERLFDGNRLFVAKNPGPSRESLPVFAFEGSVHGADLAPVKKALMQAGKTLEPGPVSGNPAEDEVSAGVTFGRLDGQEVRVSGRHDPEDGILDTLAQKVLLTPRGAALLSALQVLSAQVHVLPALAAPFLTLTVGFGFALLRAAAVTALAVAAVLLGVGMIDKLLKASPGSVIRGLALSALALTGCTVYSSSSIDYHFPTRDQVVAMGNRPGVFIWSGDSQVEMYDNYTDTNYNLSPLEQMDFQFSEDQDPFGNPALQKILILPFQAGGPSADTEAVEGQEAYYIQEFSGPDQPGRLDASVTGDFVGPGKDGLSLTTTIGHEDEHLLWSDADTWQSLKPSFGYFPKQFEEESEPVYSRKTAQETRSVWKQRYIGNSWKLFYEAAQPTYRDITGKDGNSKNAEQIRADMTAALLTMGKMSDGRKVRIHRPAHGNFRDPGDYTIRVEDGPLSGGKTVTAGFLSLIIDADEAVVHVRGAGPDGTNIDVLLDDVIPTRPGEWLPMGVPLVQMALHPGSSPSLRPLPDVPEIMSSKADWGIFARRADDGAGFILSAGDYVHLPVKGHRAPFSPVYEETLGDSAAVDAQGAKFNGNLNSQVAFTVHETGLVSGVDGTDLFEVVDRKTGEMFSVGQSDQWPLQILPGTAQFVNGSIRVKFQVLNPTSAGWSAPKSTDQVFEVQSPLAPGATVDPAPPAGAIQAWPVSANADSALVNPLDPAGSARVGLAQGSGGMEVVAHVDAAPQAGDGVAVIVTGSDGSADAADSKQLLFDGVNTPDGATLRMDGYDVLLPLSVPSGSKVEVRVTEKGQVLSSGAKPLMGGMNGVVLPMPFFTWFLKDQEGALQTLAAHHTFFLGVLILSLMGMLAWQLMQIKALGALEAAVAGGAPLTAADVLPSDGATGPARPKADHKTAAPRSFGKPGKSSKADQASATNRSSKKERKPWLLALAVPVLGLLSVVMAGCGSPSSGGKADDTSGGDNGVDVLNPGLPSGTVSRLPADVDALGGDVLHVLPSPTPGGYPVFQAVSGFNLEGSEHGLQFTLQTPAGVKGLAFNLEPEGLSAGSDGKTDVEVDFIDIENGHYRDPVAVSATGWSPLTSAALPKDQTISKIDVSPPEAAAASGGVSLRVDGIGDSSDWRRYIGKVDPLEVPKAFGSNGTFPLPGGIAGPLFNALPKLEDRLSDDTVQMQADEARLLPGIFKDVKAAYVLSSDQVSRAQPGDGEMILPMTSGGAGKAAVLDTGGEKAVGPFLVERAVQSLPWGDQELQQWTYFLGISQMGGTPEAYRAGAARDYAAGTAALFSDILKNKNAAALQRFFLIAPYFAVTDGTNVYLAVFDPPGDDGKLKPAKYWLVKATQAQDGKSASLSIGNLVFTLGSQGEVLSMSGGSTLGLSSDTPDALDLKGAPGGPIFGNPGVSRLQGPTSAFPNVNASYTTGDTLSPDGTWSVVLKTGAVGQDQTIQVKVGDGTPADAATISAYEGEKAVSFSQDSSMAAVWVAPLIHDVGAEGVIVLSKDKKVVLPRIAAGSDDKTFTSVSMNNAAAVLSWKATAEEVAQYNAFVYFSGDRKRWYFADGRVGDVVSASDNTDWDVIQVGGAMEVRSRKDGRLLQQFTPPGPVTYAHLSLAGIPRLGFIAGNMAYVVSTRNGAVTVDQAPLDPSFKIAVMDGPTPQYMDMIFTSGNQSADLRWFSASGDLAYILAYGPSNVSLFHRPGGNGGDIVELRGFDGTVLASKDLGLLGETVASAAFDSNGDAAVILQRTDPVAGTVNDLWIVDPKGQPIVDGEEPGMLVQISAGDVQFISTTEIVVNYKVWDAAAKTWDTPGPWFFSPFIKTSSQGWSVVTALKENKLGSPAVIEVVKDGLVQGTPLPLQTDGVVDIEFTPDGNMALDLSETFSSGGAYVAGNIRVLNGAGAIVTSFSGQGRYQITIASILVDHVVLQLTETASSKKYSANFSWDGTVSDTVLTSQLTPQAFQAWFSLGNNLTLFPADGEAVFRMSDSSGSGLLTDLGWTDSVSIPYQADGTANLLIDFLDVNQKSLLKRPIPASMTGAGTWTSPDLASYRQGPGAVVYVKVINNVNNAPVAFSSLSFTGKPSPAGTGGMIEKYQRRFEPRFVESLGKLWGKTGEILGRIAARVFWLPSLEFALYFAVPSAVALGLNAAGLSGTWGSAFGWVVYVVASLLFIRAHESWERRGWAFAVSALSAPFLFHNPLAMLLVHVSINGALLARESLAPAWNRAFKRLINTALLVLESLWSAWDMIFMPRGFRIILTAVTLFSTLLLSSGLAKAQSSPTSNQKILSAEHWAVDEGAQLFGLNAVTSLPSNGPLLKGSFSMPFFSREWEVSLGSGLMLARLNWGSMPDISAIFPDGTTIAPSGFDRSFGTIIGVPMRLSLRAGLAHRADAALSYEVLPSFGKGDFSKRSLWVHNVAAQTRWQAWEGNFPLLLSASLIGTFGSADFEKDGGWLKGSFSAVTATVGAVMSVWEKKTFSPYIGVHLAGTLAGISGEGEGPSNITLGHSVVDFNISNTNITVLPQAGFRINLGAGFSLNLDFTHSPKGDSSMLSAAYGLDLTSRNERSGPTLPSTLPAPSAQVKDLPPTHLSPKPVAPPLSPLLGPRRTMLPASPPAAASSGAPIVPSKPSPQASPVAAPTPSGIPSGTPEVPVSPIPQGAPDGGPDGAPNGAPSVPPDAGAANPSGPHTLLQPSRFPSRPGISPRGRMPGSRLASRARPSGGAAMAVSEAGMMANSPILGMLWFKNRLALAWRNFWSRISAGLAERRRKRAREALALELLDAADGPESFDASLAAKRVLGEIGRRPTAVISAIEDLDQAEQEVVAQQLSRHKRERGSARDGKGVFSALTAAEGRRRDAASARAAETALRETSLRVVMVTKADRPNLAAVVERAGTEGRRVVVVVAEADDALEEAARRASAGKAFLVLPDGSSIAPGGAGIPTPPRAGSQEPGGKAGLLRHGIDGAPDVLSMKSLEDILTRADLIKDVTAPIALYLARGIDIDWTDVINAFLREALVEIDGVPLVREDFERIGRAASLVLRQA